jgi:precorrin-2 dehydrogenase/sirohydrochlorin ferrochelatase
VTPRAYYPAFIDLGGKPCVVVGGGRVAERKVSALLEAGAGVTVVTPALTRGLSGKSSAGEIGHRARRFRPSDLRGVFLVIAATDSEEENRRISQAAGEAGVPLVNVVDMPEHCGFIVPATVKRGPLTIAVSTSGASPAMARAIREELQESYGPAFGKYLGVLRKERARALREMEDPKERERFLKSLVSGEVLDALRQGKQPRRGRRVPGKKRK